MTTSDQRFGAHHSQPPPSSGASRDHTTGGRAVVTIIEQTGTTRTFVAHWASPRYLILRVAHFLTWIDEGRQRLVTQSWLAYADAFPGTLPRQEVTGGEAADGTRIGDLDYRYQLYLHEDTDAFLLQVYSMREPASRRQPRLVFELTRATLFAQAAQLCHEMVDRAQRWADSHGGNPPPGNDPDVWRRHEARFRRIHASTPVTALGANLAAHLVPATFDVPYPAIQVAGVWVFAYVDRHGTVRISAHLDDAEPWLLRGDRTVPIQVAVQDTTVFEG